MLMLTTCVEGQKVLAANKLRRKTFAILDVGLKVLFADPINGITMEQYLDIYHGVHEMVSHFGRAEKLGGELYIWLEIFLEEHLTAIASTFPTDADDTSGFCRAYIREWDKYLAAAEKNVKLFRPLQRGWIKRKVEQQHDGTYQIPVIPGRLHWILDLHKLKWGECVLNHVLTSADDRTVKQKLEMIMMDVNNRVTLSDSKTIRESFGPYSDWATTA